MQTGSNQSSVVEKESRLLFGVSLSVGCLVLLCVLLSLVAAGLAVLWTLEGKLGPGGGLLPRYTLTFLSLT